MSRNPSESIKLKKFESAATLLSGEGSGRFGFKIDSHNNKKELLKLNESNRYIVEPGLLIGKHHDSVTSLNISKASKYDMRTFADNSQTKFHE